jgi:RNA polymerase sigma-70 factor, ECF subfamily
MAPLCASIKFINIQKGCKMTTSVVVLLTPVVSNNLPLEGGGMLSPGMPSEHLVAQIIAGNPAALEMLYDRYAPVVMGVAFRVVQDQAAAEDVVQETFWRVWKNCAGFQREQGTFSSWLFAITRNIAIDRWRKMKHTPTTSLGCNDEGDQPLENQADPRMNVAESAFDTMKHQQVRAAIQRLPKEQSQVIKMAYFQGLSRQEIAKTLQTPLGIVHTRARLALQKLRVWLAEL